MKTALTISASDSCGGSGIQTDLKTFSVLGVYGMSAVTAVCAQNTLGVKRTVELEPRFVAEQIDAVASDIQADACKTGTLGPRSVIEAVEDALKRNKMVPYVLDVVLPAAGKKGPDDGIVAGIRKSLFPLASLVIIGRSAAAVLAGASAESLAAVPLAKDAARRLAALGARALLIKAFPAGDQTVDLFFDGKEFFEFAAKTQPAEKTFGAGDAFSAAVTAGLANRLELPAAIDQAKQLANMAIQYSDGQGRGTTAVNVLAFAPKKK